MPKSVHTPAYHRFLQLLAAARAHRGWSQRELGRRLGAHHTYVNMCESGERQLNIVELRLWCRALDLSFAEFAAHIDAALDELEATAATPATPPAPTPIPPPSASQ